MISKIKDPFSALSHLFGALLAIVGLVALLTKSISIATPLHTISYAIYGASLVLLYSASTVYHFFKVSKNKERVLRYIDHMMIYVLIAGTYTPICLIALQGAHGKTMLIAIWCLAIVGIVVKGVWFDAPRWLSTLIYVFMGWLVILAVPPLITSIGRKGFAWLLAGGIVYSIGAIIYGTKWPNISSKIVGFHEIFHLFILGGSFCHYWLIYRYII